MFNYQQLRKASLSFPTRHVKCKLDRFFFQQLFNFFPSFPCLSFSLSSILRLTMCCLVPSGMIHLDTCQSERFRSGLKLKPRRRLLKVLSRSQTDKLNNNSARSALDLKNDHRYTLGVIIS